MKTITVIGADFVTTTGSLAFGQKDLVIEGSERMSVSDGYHTFDELYEHRITLFIALCRAITIQSQNIVSDSEGNACLPVWKSKLHSDGTSFDGWFIMGINRAKDSQITYHLPMSKWEETQFAQELEKAPEWDGHTPSDVLGRLSLL